MELFFLPGLNLNAAAADGLCLDGFRGETCLLSTGLAACRAGTRVGIEVKSCTSVILQPQQVYHSSGGRESCDKL